MVLASQGASSSFVVLVSTGFIILVFAGIGVAIVLSVIPAYLSTRNLTPAGEKYCINDLRLNVTLNSTSPYGNFSITTANDSYLLSLACYRILQNYKSDSQLSACLIYSCNFTANVLVNSGIISPNISCQSTIYYSSRCPDEAATSGINATSNSTTNSACRKKRLSNINTALGSSSVVYTNVPSITVSNIIVPVISVSGIIFSNYSGVGAYYCGLINQTSIATAVNTQATG